MKTLTRSHIGALLSAALIFAVGAVLFHGNPVRAETNMTSVQPAPAWKLKDLDGKVVNSDQFKGKVVVVDFWATWCGPCVGEIPGYIELQKKYGAQGLVIVGVSMDRISPAKVKEFVQTNGMNYTVVTGDADVVDAFGGVEGYPTTFLIDRNGQIVHKKLGAMAPEEYERIVQRALK